MAEASQSDEDKANWLTLAAAWRRKCAASGERVASGAMTAAHRSLPFGTKVRVTNKRSGRSVVVRINDRGPFVSGRVIDLTPAAAKALGFSGLARVELAVVD
jgi:rare lipoprotein A